MREELREKLQDLEDIARNPNLKGGVWVSFHSFISISDELLKNEEFKDSWDNEELKSIRKKFKENFGFEPGVYNGRTSRFETLKNCKRDSHKFRNKIFQFLQSFQGKFI